jgi:hypothetical protein
MDNENVDQKIAELRADTQNKFDQILFTIAELSKNLPKTDPLASTPQELLPAPTEPHRPRMARPAVPPDFDGDRAKGKAFINACLTYFRLCPKEFQDEQTKIVWAMSYMKTGRAQKWTDRMFQWEQQNPGSNKFFGWSDFVDEFKKDFTPAHADTLAVNRLETSAYFQKARSLDDYLDEFQDLITESGYTDPKTIVVKFRRGLNPQIQNAVATMASGRPSDIVPAEWYAMARTVDDNRATNEAFVSANHPSQTTSRPTTFSAARFSPANTSQGHAHLVPTPGNPVPMDLDAARRRALKPAECFRCKKTGHYSQNCPDRYDVRAMTLDEIQEIFENRLAQLDVAPADDPKPSAEPSAAEEDFLPSSE